MGLAPVEGLATLTDAECIALRDRLRDRGFGPAIIAFGEAVAPSVPFDRMRLPMVRWALEKRGDAASVLARLFSYGDRVAADAAREALGAALFDRLLATSVLVATEGAVQGGFQIVPVDDLFFLADDLEHGSDAVMPPGPTTFQLVESLPTRFAGSMLDVGTGPGTLAIVAARAGAKRVVGVDISERAIAQARFNARLNGVQVEFGVGDLLTPVAGQRFDLVVAQPPYVVHPGDTESVTFLHGGEMGDEIAMRLLHGLKGVLKPEGHGMVLFDSPVREKAPLIQRVREALGARTLDLVVLMGRAPDPHTQSIHCAMIEEPLLDDRYVAACRRYRTHLDRLGVTEVTHALVLVRAPSSSAAPTDGMSIALPVPALPRGRGETLATMWASLDLASSTDAALLRAALATHTGTRWLEERTSPDPAVQPTYSLRFAPGSIATDREITEAGHALFGLVDGAANVAAMVQGFAELCESGTAEVRDQVLSFARDGLARGLLRPRPR